MEFSRGKGISTFGAIVATVGGLFLAAGIAAVFGGGNDSRAFFTIVLWMVSSAGLGAWFENIGF